MTRRRLRVVIGKRIREIRRGQRLSQERLALDAGCAVSTIGRLERGQLNVTIDLVEAIVDALSTPPAELFRVQLSPASERRETDIRQKLDAILQSSDRNSINSLSVIMDSLLNYRRVASHEGR